MTVMTTRSVLLMTFIPALMYSQENGDSTMGKKDEELARLRGKLEKRWGNDSDSSYTYLDRVTGSRYPLTPFLMDEWVCGMVSHSYALYVLF
jgi:hypothetical protein